VKIENILFDLGGVLYEISPERMRSSFFGLCVQYGVEPNRDELFRLFDAMELGVFAEPEFYEEIRRTTGMPASDDELRNAWNAILVGPYPFAAELTRLAAANRRVALLSNTNAIHRDRFHTETQDVFASMERIFFSFEIGARKPNPEAFLHVVETMGYKPEYTLFVEDTPANIEAAKNLGFQVYHATDPSRIFDDLSDLLRKS
jgi:putative hydrolase of the HAD superfamily